MTSAFWWVAYRELKTSLQYQPTKGVTIMVMSIDQALITEFSDMVHHEAQQMQSRLKPYLVVKQMSGDLFAYDGLGRVDAREVSGRNVPATFDDITHNRRKISRRRFVVNLPIDASDVRGALLNPESEYAKSVAAAMMRQYDKVAYDAAFADVLTGRDFETTVTATNDGVDTVDATAGLTYEKLLELRQNFYDNDVGLDENEQIFLTITGKEHTALMGEEELISGDFTRDFVVENGRISRALGMHLIPFAGGIANPILSVASGVRSLLAASSRGLCLGVSKEMSIKIEDRPDYIETKQVQVVMEIGAVRTEGVLVQKVTTTA
jgi:hypothetical protein